ncbi:hypothetical protein PVAP13_7KG122911 [Panicum virgatum]|uniref:Uncharacterized protein n=1 Tax=Panicum virgatum TaxID=38727 RepID=A0A8T0QMJ1_PANVG|nr:hypothetical protein PVAP13_7KG122911 [Panicum virgatum]
MCEWILASVGGSLSLLSLLARVRVELLSSLLAGTFATTLLSSRLAGEATVAAHREVTARTGLLRRRRAACYAEEAASWTQGGEGWSTTLVALPPPTTLPPRRRVSRQLRSSSH